MPGRMIAALDVQYAEDRAHAGIVLFSNWKDESAADWDTLEWGTPSEYVPGEFFRRELPVLTALIDRHLASIHTLVVDSYVDLDENHAPGLGRHLYRHYAKGIPVIGVAKSRFKDSSHAVEVFRGRSRRPLFVTAAGISNLEAGNRILEMSGDSRLPVLLKLVDSIARRQ